MVWLSMDPCAKFGLDLDFSIDLDAGDFCHLIDIAVLRTKGQHICEIDGTLLYLWNKLYERMSAGSTLMRLPFTPLSAGMVAESNYGQGAPICQSPLVVELRLDSVKYRALCMEHLFTFKRRVIDALRCTGLTQEPFYVLTAFLALEPQAHLYFFNNLLSLVNPPQLNLLREVLFVDSSDQRALLHEEPQECAISQFEKHCVDLFAGQKRVTCRLPLRAACLLTL
jgi:hypothetical protein